MPLLALAFAISRCTYVLRLPHRVVRGITLAKVGHQVKSPPLANWERRLEQHFDLVTWVAWRSRVSRSIPVQPLRLRYGRVVASFAGLNRQAEAQGTACGRRAGSGSLVIFAGNHLKRGLEVL